MFVLLSCRLIAALWSPAWKGLTSWLLYVMFSCVFVTFPFGGVLGQAWYLIVSIPDLCLLTYFYKYTLFPLTIVHWNALPHHIPTLPTLPLFSTAVCQVVKYQHLFLFFNNTHTLHHTVQTHLTDFLFDFILTNPSSSWHIPEHHLTSSSEV